MLTGRDIQLVAVSVDSAAQSEELATKLGIDVNVLYSDQTGLAARSWEVWDADTEIALAATFVIAKGGELVFRYIGADKTDRPDVATIAAAIDQHDDATSPPPAE